MKVGDEIKLLENRIIFKNLNIIEKNNYQSLKAEFELKEKNNSIIFFPEVRVYNQPEIFTSEADIKTGIFKDNFLVFSVIKDSEYFNVRYQYKPFMIWIWLSIFLISVGGFFGFRKK